MKNKETYAVAKNLLEKYGEKITPEIQSPVLNGNDVRQRASMKPSTPMVENHNTPVRGGSTRLAGRQFYFNPLKLNISME